jgi:hypothetical protein
MLTVLISRPQRPELRADKPVIERHTGILQHCWFAYGRNRGNAMTDRIACKLDERTLVMARAAGLDRALADFPDCVADAARAAAQDLADMPAIEGVAEPWPSMRVRSAR